MGRSDEAEARPRAGAAGTTGQMWPTGGPHKAGMRQKGREAEPRYEPGKGEEDRGGRRKGGERGKKGGGGREGRGLLPQLRCRGQLRAPQAERRTQPQGPGPDHLVTCFAAAELPAARAPALKRLRGPTYPEGLWSSRAPSHGVSDAVPVATPKASGTDKEAQAAGLTGSFRDEASQYRVTSRDTWPGRHSEHDGSCSP